MVRKLPKWATNFIRCKFLKNQRNICFVDKIIRHLNKGIIFYFCNLNEI